MAGTDWQDGLQILDLVHESIFVRDLDFKITYWNAAAEALYGWTRAEAVGRHADELLRCVHPLPLAQREAQLFATGHWQGEFERVAKSGAVRTVEATWAVRRNESGQPVEVIETGRDITDRRRAVQALAESEKKYRDLFHLMPIALWSLDSRKMRDMFDSLRAAGVEDLPAYIREHPEFLDEAQSGLRVTEANEQTMKLFAATDREKLLEEMPRLWLTRNDWAGAAAARLAGAPGFSTESTIRRLNGTEAEVLFSVAFADPANPDSLNMVGAIDISERKRTTEALAQSELKYRNLFQHMPLSLWQLNVRELSPVLAQLRSEGVEDLDGYMDDHPDFVDRMMRLMKVEQVNDRTVEIFGGNDTSDFVGPVAQFWVDSPETIRRSLAARFSGAESYSEETRVRTLDGRTIDIYFRSAFPPALAELGIGLAGAIDIGDRVEAERVLQRVQADFAHAARVATLGELTASIAHEVNQPLAAIATNGEATLRWLSRDEPDIGEVRSLASRIVADARRAADVIAHIRTMAGRNAPERSPVDLNGIIRESLEFLQHELEDHGVSFGFECCADMPPVLGDRTQLQQVIVNLAVNAIQSMAKLPNPRARLTVRTRLNSDGLVTVEIDDNGPGIDLAHLPQLFDSFFTTKGSGLGIGLSICRSIVESHGGQIECCNLPTGARFSFVLPGITRTNVGVAAFIPTSE